MKEQLEERLVELRAEYESGQKILKDIELKLAELEDRKKVLSDTLIRISGAIDLLEEVLGEESHQELRASSKPVSGVVEVPNVVRQPLEKAKKALEDSGLSVGEIVEQKGVLPIGVMVGEVLRQEPQPGTKLPAGSPVKLIIASKGKLVPSLDKRSACSTLSDRD
ncbi:MAG TPA: PASTA domain-containing protein [Methanosarcina sp.]|nr:PASTA domain-containing protein [Methanosarcina sp.]